MMKAEPVLGSDLVRQLPVGNPTFTDIRANGQIYVDKTDLIVELIQSYPSAFLVLPRRFGKTLLVSTIQTLFLKGRDAFRGLKAGDLWNEPPKAVVRLDLSVIANARSGEEFRTLLDRLLEPELYKYFPPSAHENNPALRLNAALSPQPGKSVVILIDEYDAPLTANIGRAEIFEDIMKEMSVFFETLKSLSGKIRFLFVTGIMNFRQTSLFSSFTNLKDLSLLPEFSSLLGFSEEEVRTCFAPYLKYYAGRKGITEAKLLSELLENYGGFCFDINGLRHICSPWSILNYFHDDNIDFYGNYWVKSAGSISFLMMFLRKANLLRPEDFDREYEIKFRELQAAERITAARPAIFLANAGFLTIRRSEPSFSWMEGVGCDLKLGYPNIEVRRSMIVAYNAAYWPDTQERVDPGSLSAEGLNFPSKVTLAPKMPAETS
ncbi:AAA family ATPase, partial [uncultured Sutterella sp.]|uniref:AAA family ATPase n=1 Tax=uncultured Sutterella sp. TaxID=286133 RepID=UPI0026382012